MSDSTQEQTQDIVKEEKGFLGGLLRLIFFAVAFFAIIFTVMANMGGSSDTLKESIENFVSDTLGGRPTRVERLVRMSFFPLVGFDAEGLEVRLSNETSDIGLRVDKVRAFMSFWDVVLKKPRVRSLLIESLDAEEGVLGRQAFSIEKAFLDHNKDDNTAKVRANGVLGAHDWGFSINTKVFGKSPKYSYLLDKEKPFVFDIANLGMQGILKDKVEDYIRIEDFSFRFEDKEFLTGVFSLSKLEHKMMKFRGDLVFGAGKSVMRPDVVIDFSQNPIKVSGTLNSKALVLSDLRGENSLESAYARIYDVLAWEKGAAHELDMKVEIKEIKPSGVAEPYGYLSIEIEQKDGVLKLGAVKGEPGGETLSVHCTERDQEAKGGQEEDIIEPVYVDAVLFQKLDGVLNLSSADHPCHGHILEKQND